MRHDNYSQYTKQTQRQTRWWSYAAWTLPFIALAILVVEEYIGLEELYQKTIATIVVIFFAVSVFWWWWALHKIKYVIQSLRSTDKHFKEVKQEIRETQKILKGK